jgi:hypothetical protein
VQSNNKKRISAEEWQRRLRDVRIRKEDMNRVVMNFLVTEVREVRDFAGQKHDKLVLPKLYCKLDCNPALTSNLQRQQQALAWRGRHRSAMCPCGSSSLSACPLSCQGYVDAARVFERESGTAPGVDLDQITDRMNIRKAVQRGDVEQVGWQRHAVPLRLQHRAQGFSKPPDGWLAGCPSPAGQGLCQLLPCHVHTTCLHAPRVRVPLQAIEQVNDLDPEILEEQQELFFHLQQQRLIELIRQGQLQEALEFAQVWGAAL